MHFERGQDYERAVQYLQQAAANALRRFAYQEVVSHLRHGLELLASLPETPARLHQELGLQVALGAALMATQGYAFPTWSAATPGLGTCVSSSATPRTCSRRCGG